MKTSSLRQQAYEYIQAEMLSGRLIGGAQLSELAFASRIGISRTPVREAIRQLEMEGILEQVPRVGTLVRTPVRRDIVELYELREALESFAVAQAARKLVPAELAILERLCNEIRMLARRLRQSGLAALDDRRMRRFLAADMGFHLRLLQAAGNQRIMKAVAESRVLTRIFGARRQAHDLRVVLETCRFHECILAALRAADAETARRLMADHIQASRDRALHHFDSVQSGSAAQSPPLPPGMPADLVAELRHIEKTAAPPAGRAPGNPRKSRATRETSR